MSKRRKHAEKHPNHERWVISYADFTTLLLATFVVMYAVSSINNSKFQEMAEAFSTAFMGRTTTMHEQGFAAPNRAPFHFMPAPVHSPIISREKMVKDVSPGLRQQVVSRVNKLNDAFKELNRLLAGMISKGQVRVSLQSMGVVIDINAVLLFESGKAELTPEALGLVDQIGGVLKTLSYEIQVNGFTDDAPIHTAQFDSNWDLSATRAISVVKRLVLDGVNPVQLVGAGFGEYHPVAPNTTSEGKAMNRRVSIVVVSPGTGTDPEHTPLLGGKPGQAAAVDAGQASAATAAKAGGAGAAAASPAPDQAR